MSPAPPTGRRMGSGWSSAAPTDRAGPVQDSRGRRRTGPPDDRARHPTRCGPRPKTSSSTPARTWAGKPRCWRFDPMERLWNCRQCKRSPPLSLDGFDFCRDGSGVVFVRRASGCRGLLAAGSGRQEDAAAGRAYLDHESGRDSNLRHHSRRQAHHLRSVERQLGYRADRSSAASVGVNASFGRRFPLLKVRPALRPERNLLWTAFCGWSQRACSLSPG